MSYKEGETGERGKGQWLWKLPVVDLVDDIKDATVPIKMPKGAKNKTVASLTTEGAPRRQNPA